MSTDVLESARAFARAGFPVFPCGPDKRPRVKWKGAATTDDATICQWWRDRPESMIGLPTGSTSGLYVIDLDIDKETGEPVGEQTITSLGLKSALAGAPSALTTTGGRHFYFRHPGDGWGNTARKIGAGIDTRGEGGYVIAPGSVNGAGALSPPTYSYFAVEYNLINVSIRKCLWFFVREKQKSI